MDHQITVYSDNVIYHRAAHTTKRPTPRTKDASTNNLTRCNSTILLGHPNRPTILTLPYRLLILMCRLVYELRVVIIMSLDQLYDIDVTAAPHVQKPQSTV